MKQWIRLPGLIGFVVTLALLIAFWMLFAGGLIKDAIEVYGSEAAGAKVEVASVDLSFSPLGITLNNIQVADADKPMQNLVQLDKAVADLELMPLLLGKGIVNELSIAGMKFETPRNTSGVLAQKTKSEQDEASSDEPDNSKDGKEESVFSSVKIPSADEILAREPLQTEIRGKAFQQSFETGKQELDEALAQVPDESSLKSYEDDFNKITKGKLKSLKDFEQRKKALSELKKRIKADKKAISSARKILVKTKDDLQGQWKGLKDAPGEDYENITHKYQISGAGASNISKLIFGDKASIWTEKALYWYEKVRPFITSDEEADTKQQEKQARAGRFVHFKTDNPLPDFLIRKTRVQLDSELGTLNAEALDITHQQAILGRPILVDVTGHNLQEIQSLELSAVLDHRKAQGIDSFNLAIKDMEVKGWDLGYEGLKLKNALVQVQANGVLQQGQLLAEGTGLFNQAHFDGKASGGFAKELQKTMQKIKQFNVKGEAKGKLTAPKIGISSNLDKAISGAFNQRLKEKKAKLEKDLKKQLNEKLLSYTGDYQDQLKGMDLANGKLGDKQKALEDMAKGELNSWQDQQKQEAKAKAKKEQKKLEKKLKDKLKGFKF